MNAKFIDLNAAADYLGPGAIEVERYQTEITTSFEDVESSGKESARCLQPGTHRDSSSKQPSTHRQPRKPLSIPETLRRLRGRRLALSEPFR